MDEERLAELRRWADEYRWRKFPWWHRDAICDLLDALDAARAEAARLRAALVAVQTWVDDPSFCDLCGWDNDHSVDCPMHTIRAALDGRAGREEG